MSLMKVRSHLTDKYNTVNPNCSYLEAHIIDLSRGNIRSTFGHGDARDIVRVSMQEFLFAIFDSLQNDGGSQRIDQVLPVRMNPQTGAYMAWPKTVKNNRS